MKTKKNRIKPCILLTTTVHINNKIPLLYQKNKQERVDTYLKSIEKWLTYTSLPIVVVENSGYTFPEIKSPNLEIIAFDSKDYKYGKGQKGSKGVHEAFSILYALKHSIFLKNCSHFVKVTGRYFIPSFEPLLRSIPYSCKAIRQHDTTRCEVVGCKKSIGPSLFELPMKLKNKLESHVESVYQERINQLSPVVTLPMLKITPTKRGGVNETFTSL